MKNSNTKFNADSVSAPETTNTAEVAVTETHDVAVALPEGVDLATIMQKAALLDQAEVAMSLKADYLELASGQSFRGIFMGFGTATHKSPNEGEGLVEKKCIKIILSKLKIEKTFVTDLPQKLNTCSSQANVESVGLGSILYQSSRIALIKTNPGLI